MDEEVSVLHVLTVHFNTPDLTLRLIRALPSTTARGRHVKVHVLDNDSTPKNQSMLEDGLAGLPNVTFKVSNENIGFGKGLNLLASSGSIREADILWFLNPDTELQSGCLDRLESELALGHFAVISPLIFSGEGLDTWIWYCGGTISERQIRPNHALYGEPTEKAPTQSFETDFVTGAAPMMHASTFRDAGGFPPGYFLYWEDAYLSWKLRDVGFKLGVVPRAQLWHAVGASSGTGQSRTFYYWFARNRFTYAGDIGVRRGRLLLGFGAVETFRIVGRALFEREGRSSKFLAAVQGTISGYKNAAKS